MINEIRGYSASEIEEFVGKGSDKYIERFKTLKKFNWAAAIFRSFWFGYRKMYIEGVLIALLESSISNLGEAVLSFFLLQNKILDYSSVLYYCIAYRIAEYIVRFIIFGFIADRIYWINIKRRIVYAHMPQEIRNKKIGLMTFYKTCKSASIGGLIAFIIIEIVLAFIVGSIITLF